MIKVKQNDNKELLQAETAEYINRCLKEVQTNGKPTLLVLAGGSYIDVYKQINPNHLDSNLTLVVLDERFSRDPAKNNLAQIENKANNFYTYAIANGCKVIDTKVKENETRKGLADRFNNELVKWLSENPEGNVIITAGVGPDGHISGMKPLPKNEFEKLFESGNNDELVVDYDASQVDADNPERVTTTMNFFRRVKDIAKIIVYAFDKADALKNVRENTGDINTNPALILNEMKDVTIFSN